MDSKAQPLYEVYHKSIKLQKRIINDNNFTYRELIKLLKPYLTKVETVLDIGSGAGTIDFYLASKGKKVTGIEISQQAVSTARRNAKYFGFGERVEFINATFPDNIPRKKFDLVILSEVIEHLEDDKQALEDVWNVLKPGGFLILTTPSKTAPLKRLGLLKKFDREVGHLRRYDLSTLTRLISASGFKIEKTGVTEGIIRNLMFTNRFAGILLKGIRGKISDITAYVDYISLRLFGESNIYVIAKKASKVKKK